MKSVSRKSKKASNLFSKHCLKLRITQAENKFIHVSVFGPELDSLHKRLIYSSYSDLALGLVSCSSIDNMGSCCSEPSRASQCGRIGPICDPTGDDASTSQDATNHTGATTKETGARASSTSPHSETMPYGASLHRTLCSHCGDVNGVAFGENTLATCGGDKTVRVWNVTDFCELGFSPLREHSYSVNGCTYSPVENILVTFSTDGKAVLWNVKVGDKIGVLTHPSQSSIRVCHFSPSGDILATGSDDETLCLWDVASRKIIRYSINRSLTLS